jgi:hypothetical protein
MRAWHESSQARVVGHSEGERNFHILYVTPRHVVTTSRHVTSRHVTSRHVFFFFFCVFALLFQN